MLWNIASITFQRCIFCIRISLVIYHCASIQRLTMYIQHYHCCPLLSTANLYIAFLLNLRLHSGPTYVHYNCHQLHHRHSCRSNHYHRYTRCCCYTWNEQCHSSPIYNYLQAQLETVRENRDVLVSISFVLFLYVIRLHDKARKHSINNEYHLDQ